MKADGAFDFSERGVLSRRLLQDRAQLDILVHDAGMVTLEIERTGASDICPESAAGATFNGLVIDNRLTVELDRDMAVAEGDIELLPLTCGFFGSGGGSDAAIEGGHVAVL